MKKNFFLLIVVVLTAYRVNSQSISWVKRLHGNANGEVVSTFPSPNGFIINIRYVSSAQLFDEPRVFKTDSATNGEDYSLIAFVDSTGQIMGTKFNTNIGIGNGVAINDSEFVSLLPMGHQVKINGVLKIDTTGCGGLGYGMRLFKFSRTGEVSLLHDFRLQSYVHDFSGGSNFKLVVSEDKQQVVVLFEKVIKIDTTFLDTAVIKLNQGLVAIINVQTGNLEKMISCPPLFGELSLVGQSSNIVLMGDQTDIPKSYTLNGITYSRNDSSVQDMVIASMDMDNGSILWHKVIQARLPYSNTYGRLVTSNNHIYAFFRFNDTFSIDGHSYGTVIPFNTLRRQALLSINPQQGIVDWVRLFRGFYTYKPIHTPYNSLYDGVSIDFEAESDITMDEMPVLKMVSKGHNYIRMSSDGSLAQSLNYTIVSRNTAFGSMSIPVSVNEADSTVIVIEPLEKNKPLVVNNQTYEYRSLSPWCSDFLAIRFKSTPSSNPTGVSEWASSSSKILVYPNPCTDLLYVDGLDIETAANVNVFDITGKLVISHNLYKDQPLNVQTLPQGLYFIKIQQGKMVQQTRFVKQ